MDKATRLQYLEAMGIDVWVPRHPPLAISEKAGNNADLIENPARLEDGMDTGAAALPEQHTVSAAAYDSSSAVAMAGESEADQSHYAEYWGQDEADDEQADRNESFNDWASLHSTIAPELASPPATTQPPAQASHFSHAVDHAWTDLQHEVATCRACGLCETRTQTVFGVGNKHARWLLIGEAPGQNEDLQGEPFVGRAGQLLTEMLRAIGLKREEVYIANMLKCRPPSNRDPQAEEVDACHNFLERQIDLIQPKIILAVGRIAAQNLLKTQQPLAKLRGIRHQLDNIPLIVIHHPAYLLRSLLEKAKAWEDLQFALSIYKELEK